MLDWDDYRYFLAVARAGTVTGAAQQLGVNHSTVSRRIAAMERAASVLLFDKQKDGYAL
ncbi:MAG TPA: LysR family transcriptional regulator, partial [Parvularcula sp.]|nr:LysR family transcriptional regulator [Parvularcula sp.]